jgi:hypothetical protein
MEMTVIKQIVFLKRRADLALPEFKAYYESHHRKIGERVLGGYATQYLRRYLVPLGAEPPGGFEFDVMTEMWFPNESVQKACMQHLSDPVIQEEIAIDEAKLFEPGTKWGCLVSEVESSMP